MSEEELAIYGMDDGTWDCDGREFDTFDVARHHAEAKLAKDGGGVISVYCTDPTRRDYFIDVPAEEPF